MTPKPGDPVLWKCSPLLYGQSVRLDYVAFPTDFTSFGGQVLNSKLKIFIRESPDPKVKVISGWIYRSDILAIGDINIKTARILYGL
jgi:hypothetical protein